MKIVLKKGWFRWYWKMIGKNGETLAHSETYSSKYKAKATAEKVAAALRWPLEQE